MKALVAALTTALEQDIHVARLDDARDEGARAREAAEAGEGRRSAIPTSGATTRRSSIARDDYAGNLRRASVFEVKRNFAKLGKPVDKTEWSMTPPTVNAYYASQFAEIVFPGRHPAAAVLRRDDRRRGELRRDRRGHRPRADARLRRLGPQVRRRREPEGLVDRRRRQGLRRACGVHRRPVLRLLAGERSEDGAAGLPARAGSRSARTSATTAACGSRTWPSGTRSPASRETKVDGFTPDQRFFLGFAQVWCQNTTDAESLQRILTDPHSPGVFRTNGTVSNMPEFERAFSCTPGAPMAPIKRCRVW